MRNSKVSCCYRNKSCTNHGNQLIQQYNPETRQHMSLSNESLRVCLIQYLVVRQIHYLPLSDILLPVPFLNRSLLFSLLLFRHPCNSPTISSNNIVSCCYFVQSHVTGTVAMTPAPASYLSVCSAAVSSFIQRFVFSCVFVGCLPLNFWADVSDYAMSQ